MCHNTCGKEQSEAREEAYAGKPSARAYSAYKGNSTLRSLKREFDAIMESANDNFALLECLESSAVFLWQ